MSLTRSAVATLRDRLQSKLDALGRELGFALTLGNAKFGDHVEFRLTAAPIGADGKAEDPSAAVFRRFATLFGLQPTDLGRTFRLRGATFTVTGLATNRPKFPVSARRSDGKDFKFTAETVARALRAAAPSVEVR